MFCIVYASLCIHQQKIFNLYSHSVCVCVFNQPHAVCCLCSKTDELQTYVTRFTLTQLAGCPL